MERGGVRVALLLLLLLLLPCGGAGQPQPSNATAGSDGGATGAGGVGSKNATATPTLSITATLTGSGDESSAPATLKPLLPEHAQAFQDQRERADYIASLAVVAAMFGGFGAGPLPAMRVAIAAQMCDPYYPEHTARYPPGMAPAEIIVDVEHTAFNTLIGNSVLILGLGALLYVVGHSLRSYTLRHEIDINLNSNSAFIFPSAQLVIFQMLYQGTSLAALDLVIDAASIGSVIFGVIGCVALISVPVAVLFATRHAIPDHAFVQMDTKMQHPAQKFVLGPGEWVGRSAYFRWLDRYGAVVRPYAQRAYLFSLVEYGASALLAASHAFEPHTMRGCGHQKIMAFVVSIVMIAVVAWTRPFLHPRNAAFHILLSLGEAIAMLALAIAYYADDILHGGFDVGGAMVSNNAMVLLLWTAINFIVWVYLLMSGRRMRLQDVQDDQEHREICSGTFFSRIHGSGGIPAPSGGSGAVVDPKSPVNKDSSYNSAFPNASTWRLSQTCMHNGEVRDGAAKPPGGDAWSTPPREQQTSRDASRHFERDMSIGAMSASTRGGGGAAASHSLLNAHASWSQQPGRVGSSRTFAQLAAAGQQQQQQQQQQPLAYSRNPSSSPAHSASAATLVDHRQSGGGERRAGGDPISDAAPSSPGTPGGRRAVAGSANASASASALNIKSSPPACAALGIPQPLTNRPPAHLHANRMPSMEMDIALQTRSTDMGGTLETPLAAVPPTTTAVGSAVWSPRAPAPRAPAPRAVADWHVEYPTGSERGGGGGAGNGAGSSGLPSAAGLSTAPSFTAPGPGGHGSLPGSGSALLLPLAADGGVGDPLMAGLGHDQKRHSLARLELALQRVEQMSDPEFSAGGGGGGGGGGVPLPQYTFDRKASPTEAKRVDVQTFSRILDGLRPPTSPPTAARGSPQQRGPGARRAPAPLRASGRSPPPGLPTGAGGAGGAGRTKSVSLLVPDETEL